MKQFIVGILLFLTTSLFAQFAVKATPERVIRKDIKLMKDLTYTEGSFAFNVAGFGAYSYGARSKGKQHQINIVDNLTSVRGNHTLKAGFDYRRQAPTNFNEPYAVTATFNGLQPEEEADGSLLSGTIETPRSTLPSCAVTSWGPGMFRLDCTRNASPAMSLGL